MTAYSQNIANTPYGRICWELRSVNHRYLDLYFKLPEEIRDIENELREISRQELMRGKVDCALKLESHALSSNRFEVNSDMVREIADACGIIAQVVPNCAPVSPMHILSWPGVIKNIPQDHQEIATIIKQNFIQALGSLKQMRANEANGLLKVINIKLDGIINEINKLRENTPEILDQQKNKLLTRLNDLKLSQDVERLDQELVYMLQRFDISEELDRLHIHVDEFKNSCVTGGSVGKKLDFLAQEMYRETNTIASKSSSAFTSTATIELKVLIEQIREQVQNIE